MGSDRSYYPQSRFLASKSFTSSLHQTSGRKQYCRRSRTPPRRSQGHDAMGKVSFKYPTPFFLGVLNRLSSLVAATSLPLPFIMVGPILLNMLVTLIKEWLSIPKIKALICTVFPSSLGLVAMRWFDNLEEGSIHSFEKLTKAFGAMFVTCSRVPRPLDSLLSMYMKEGETLKSYSDMYWEVYNEIDGDFEDVVMRAFKVGLHTHFDL